MSVLENQNQNHSAKILNVWIEGTRPLLFHSFGADSIAQPGEKGKRQARRAMIPTNGNAPS